MQGSNLTSDQYYGVGYGYDYIPQRERFTSTSISLSTYRGDDYNDLSLIAIQCENDYINMYL